MLLSCAGHTQKLLADSININMNCVLSALLLVMAGLISGKYLLALKNSANSVLVFAETELISHKF